jgi:hypothetical protein
MNINEIEKRILEKRKALKVLQNSVRSVSDELRELNNSKEEKLKEGFIEFIEIGSQFTFSNYANLNGTQTGIKKTESPLSPNFRAGDIITFTKRNKKSFVVRCTKKTTSKWDIVNKKHNLETKEVDITFRIDLESLYHYMTRDENFEQRLMSYIKRKDALEDLLS